PGIDDAFAGRLGIRRPRRRLTLAEIGEDQAEVLARRVDRKPDLAAETLQLGRLLDALAAAVVLPAVVDAADVVVLDPAEMHHRAAVRAALGDHLRLAGVPAIERVVLAHDADRPGAPSRQVGAVVERDPELAHERAARRAGPGGGDVDLWGAGRRRAPNVVP